jgi:NADPH-dependent 2,4-dienoyl-CoA reductase/sulfur reductase-like enzyme
MNFLIIGGDAAGMSAASKAKRNDPGMTVTVLEKTRDVSYSACGMPYLIADPDRDMDDLVVRKAEMFREKQGIDLLTGHTATRIDPSRRIVEGTDDNGNPFSHPYDKLLIATGSSPIVPPVPGADLPGVFPLKSLEHGRRIKDYIRSRTVNRAVIVGMGYIGLEMCEALTALSIEVDMIEMADRLLPWLDADMAETVRKHGESMGVRFHNGQMLTAIEKNGESLTVKSRDLEFPADLVILALGVTPNSGIAETAGIALGDRKVITVSEALETSVENIYAAGDCADAIHLVTGKKAWIPLALRANRSGWAVADTVCGRRTELRGIVGTAVFRFFDLEIARTGITADEAKSHGFDPAEVTITSRSRAHGQAGSKDIRVRMVGDRKSGRLLGAFMMGEEGVAHRINAPAVALSAMMTVEQYLETDLAYAPPFGPVWDPTLTAAIQLAKEL